MTVKELIEQLQTLPSDTHVFVRGYEDGYANSGPIGNIVDMVLDYNIEWYYGKHELAKNITDTTGYKIVKGIIL